MQSLLSCFCSSLRDELRKRSHFYRSAPLLREGILHFSDAERLIGGDLTRLSVEMDRRLLDYVCGLDTEFNELIDGSHLYAPNVALSNIVLPTDIKTTVVETAQNFEAVRFARAELSRDGGIEDQGEGLSAARSAGGDQKETDINTTASKGGSVILFHGPSGTGKTMLANAIATLLKKKILLVNFPNLGDNSPGAIAKMLFREATIHNAIVFFDECESVLQSREKDPHHRVNTLLTEIERFDGLVILATNRAAEIDEAMHRRITLAVEFQKPNHVLREQIWASLRPPRLKLSDDVNLDALAHKFELTGGFIKNAWMAAIGFAVARRDAEPMGGAGADGSSEGVRAVSNLMVTMEDLTKGASQQLRGHLSAAAFDRKIVPRAGLDEACVLPAELRESLSMVVSCEKAKNVLLGEWGFGEASATGSTTQGVALLFHGTSGTGKTLAAEALGYDLGNPNTNPKPTPQSEVELN